MSSEWHRRDYLEDASPGNHSGEADQKDNACAEGTLARDLPIISVSLDEAGRADIHDRQERSRVVEALCGSFATSQE